MLPEIIIVVKQSNIRLIINSLVIICIDYTAFCKRLPCLFVQITCFFVHIKNCLINASLSTFVEWFPLRSNERDCLIALLKCFLTKASAYARATAGRQRSQSKKPILKILSILSKIEAMHKDAKT